MDYLKIARDITILLNTNISLHKKFQLCVLQFYLIKKYMKKLKAKCIKS